MKITKTVVLPDAGRVNAESAIKRLKPIQFVQVLSRLNSCGPNWSGGVVSPSGWGVIELVCPRYCPSGRGADLDLMFAYDFNYRENGSLYLGHWNDGVAA